MLINCDPFHSFFFLASAIYSEDAVQKLAAELCESHKTLVTGFFLKKLQNATQLRKEFIKGSFPWNLQSFSEQVFSRTNLGECFYFRSCPCGAPSKRQVFQKQPLSCLKKSHFGMGVPCKLPYIFRAFNTKNTSGRLLLVFDSLNK